MVSPPGHHRASTTGRGLRFKGLVLVHVAMCQEVLFSALSRDVGREKPTHYPVLQQILKRKHMDCLHFNPCFFILLPNPSFGILPFTHQCFLLLPPEPLFLATDPTCTPILPSSALCIKHRRLGLNEEGNPMEKELVLTFPRARLPPGPLGHGSRKRIWQAAVLTGLFVPAPSGYS